MGPERPRRWRVQLSITEGGDCRLVEPHVIHDRERRAMPWLVRRMLGVMHVDDFLVATVKR